MEIMFRASRIAAWCILITPWSLHLVLQETESVQGEPVNGKGPKEIGGLSLRIEGQGYYLYGSMSANTEKEQIKTPSKLRELQDQIGVGGFVFARVGAGPGVVAAGAVHVVGGLPIQDRNARRNEDESHSTRKCS